MNKGELIAAMAEKTGSSKSEAEAALNAFVDVVTDALTSDDTVTVSGFCKFARVETAARKGRNPATGEEIQIAASRRPKVTALKAFKDAVR